MKKSTIFRIAGLMALLAFVVQFAVWTAGNTIKENDKAFEAEIKKDDWKLYDTSMDDTDFMVRNDKAIKKGNTVVFAVKEVLPEEQPLITGSDIKYRYKKEIVTADCKTKYVESIAFIKYYNNNDELVYGPDNEKGYKLEPTYMITDLVNKVCKAGKF